MLERLEIQNLMNSGAVSDSGRYAEISSRNTSLAECTWLLLLLSKADGLIG